MNQTRRSFMANIAALFLGAGAAGCEVRVRLESKPTEVGARWVMADGRVVPWEGGLVDVERGQSLGVESVTAPDGSPVEAILWADPVTDTYGADDVDGCYHPGLTRLHLAQEFRVVASPFVLHLKDGSKIYSRGAV